MAVDKLLPVGTKVRITSDVEGLKAGDIYTVIQTEAFLDGQSHCVDAHSRSSDGWWVYDNCIEEVNEEAPEEKTFVASKEVTFEEIVQMIAEDTVPTEATFVIEDGCEATVEYDPTFGMNVLRWDSGKNVQLSKEIASAPWRMKVPSLKLPALEAMAELQKGKSVRGVHGGEEFTLSPYDDFDDIWEDSPWADMNELLNKTDFYKVAA
ncbi:hypothetical protein ACOJB1_12685 [Enterococcus innesii]|uniref:hypothetical protein n=1 Tax=Enterococcus innesii TaxID=2839759 RepID=UPI003B5B4303